MCAFLATFALGAVAFMLTFAGTAQAKEVVDYFGAAAASGTQGGDFDIPSGVAVNHSGAGPAEAGDIYVGDVNNNRIQRFGRDDQGTATPYDDTYFFISAWGADVDSVPTGGSDYEICTVASQCKTAAVSDGNGALNFNPNAGGRAYLAVDSDTGNVFVSDYKNFRVNAYAGDGAFLYSFGFDVIATGSPNDAGTGYEVCVAADGDTCKVGLPGSGAGQIGDPIQQIVGIAVSQPDGNPASGKVFLANPGNRRVNTYDLDGSDPASIGSAANFAAGEPQHVAVDSRGILYASDSENDGEVERYDTDGANGGGVGFLAPIAAGVDEQQQLTVDATAGQYHLSFDPDGGGPKPPETTIDLPYDAPFAHGGPDRGPIDTVREALRALPSIGVVGDLFDQVASGVEVFGSIVTFRGKFGAANVAQLSVADGAVPLSGGAGASVSTLLDGQPGLIPGPTDALATIDADGPGPDADSLYVLRRGVIQQFGPLNAPGNAVAPAAEDERHATGTPILSSKGTTPKGIAIDGPDGRIYVSSNDLPKFPPADGVYVLDVAGAPPTASLDSLSDPTCDSIDVHATVDPNGPPLLSYHLEYSSNGGASWQQTPDTVLGIQDDPQSVDVTLSPPGVGLEANTSYMVRLSAGKKFATAVLTGAQTLSTLACKPDAETVGAPVRSAGTAQLGGRINPRGLASTYRFEYGTTDAYGQMTPARAAGAENSIKLASETIGGLSPNTTYHYRLLADNGAPGDPNAGGDRTFTTRGADNDPLSHGEFPGPTGSDRAWEQVSIADTGGNPVTQGTRFSANGDGAIYAVAGGTPISDNGSIFNKLIGTRPAGQHPKEGWRASLVIPTLAEADNLNWTFYPAADFSQFIGINQFDQDIWRIGLGGPYTENLAFPKGTNQSFGEAVAVSEDASRAVIVPGAPGSYDPLRPVPAASHQLYDVSAAGDPRLLSLLPGEVVAACGIYADAAQSASAYRDNAARWLSADGERAFFSTKGNSCSGEAQLYVREIDAGVSRLVSGPVFSGAACVARFIRSTPGAAFFSTKSRLVAQDSANAGCTAASDGDIYRYEIASGALRCMSCAVAGLDADVAVGNLEERGGGLTEIGVSADGSRVYFISPNRLVRGAGAPGIYRIRVTDGDLAYVGSAGGGATVGDRNFSAVSADGSALAFKSSDPALDPLGGTTNAATEQYYLYDDGDRTLTCASCPQDGSAPRAAVPTRSSGIGVTQGQVTGAFGKTTLSADGSVFAFNTPSALASVDQNTIPVAGGADPLAGVDVYEWRDGRALLVSDGIKNWPSYTATPSLQGVSPSGQDIFFTAPAQYTSDAIDGFRRLYTARIGGGIDFPEEIPPCPLEVCQGTPKGAPEDPAPASDSFAGRGNPRLEGAASSCGRFNKKAKRKLRVARKAAKRGQAKRARALRRQAKNLKRRAKRCNRRAAR